LDILSKQFGGSGAIVEHFQHLLGFADKLFGEHSKLMLESILIVA
jgi:hypothetical protein